MHFAVPSIREVGRHPISGHPFFVIVVNGTSFRVCAGCEDHAVKRSFDFFDGGQNVIYFSSAVGFYR